MWETATSVLSRTDPLNGENSRHDDFVLEAAGGDEQKKGAPGGKGQAVEPEMRKAGTAQDDAAGDVDVIAGGDEKADGGKNGGRGVARGKVGGEEGGDVQQENSG